MRTSEHDEILRFMDELEKKSAPPGSRPIHTWQDIPDVGSLPDEPITWLVEGMIPRAGVVLLAGESGAYKTWLALSLAKAAATGGAFLGRSCARADVLYLDGENPAAVVRERCSILGALGLPALKVWGGWLESPPPGIGDVRLVRIAAERKPLIVFDSLIRFHAAADENSASNMAAVMAELRALAHVGASVVVLHHKAKSEASRYRGSSDIHAGVDLAFAVSYDRGAGLLRVNCFKNRLAQEFSLTLRPDLERTAAFIVADAPAASRDREGVARLQQVIAAEPGLNQRQIVERSDCAKGRTLSLLQRGEGRLWRSETGAHNAKFYYPLEPQPETLEIPL